MPKRSSKPRKQKDPFQLARSILDAVDPTAEPKKTAKKKTKAKNPAAVALGRLGGLKGGKARAEKLTDIQRSEIAANAARSRWTQHKKDGNDGTC